MSDTDTSLSNDHRARAIAKLHQELSKDIMSAARVAKTCGLWEILRFCYLLRIGRVLRVIPEYAAKLSHADLIELQLRDDALKYAISLAAKHGDWRHQAHAINSLDNFEIDRVNKLEHFTKHINAKFETEILLNVAEVRVSGSRDQDCELDIAAGVKNPLRAMYLDFGFRIEQSTMQMKSDLRSPEELIERLRREYADVGDLFESDSGISLNTFCDGMLDLQKMLRSKGEAQERMAALKQNGRIDMEARQTFIAIAKGFHFTLSELSSSLSSEFVSYMERNSFDKEKFSDSELRFHYLTRRPFLMGDGFFILSPDLIFDSLLDNIHFTLLESDAAKNEYKKRRAAQFVDEIARAAIPAGYSVTDRDVDLFKGKQQLGDIDVVLTNASTGHTLFVEAKNHALPLPVYFRDPKALDAHIASTRDWENKVTRRIDHLRSGSASYSAPGAWDYLVVSRMPEPLSHVTDLMVLSVYEFSKWVTQTPRPSSFPDFYQALYKPNVAKMSPDEIQHLVNEGYSLAQLKQN